MKELEFKYSMEIGYTDIVNECHYTIKCIPMSSARQIVDDFDILLEPPLTPDWGNDSLGNRYIYGRNGVPHYTFKYEITGRVKCGLSDYECLAKGSEAILFKHPHGLNVAGEKIKQYHAELVDAYQNFSMSQGSQSQSMQNSEGPPASQSQSMQNSVMMPASQSQSMQNSEGATSSYELATYFSSRLNADFIYEQGQTNNKTGAEEAFVKGRGVCQDYSHILISLLHLSKVPARYVTGFLIGEGASHAWVEVLSDGKWYGIDPTNNIPVTDSHIKIGVGRDANDCQINRGIMHGGGNQMQTIAVSVTEVMNI